MDPGFGTQGIPARFGESSVFGYDDEQTKKLIAKIVERAGALRECSGERSAFDSASR